MQSMRSYGVWKLVEHDGVGHLSVDEVEGTLLIYRIQEEKCMEKERVIKWIRQLVTQLDLYQRSGENPEQIRCYRYLNPYSVLITGEDQVVLLNLEDPQNEFVMKNMQKRSMRHHFVRAVQTFGENSKIAVDLYGLGKTVQFLLACTESLPGFRFWEEYQLTRFIQKCLQTEEKKRYGNLKEALKDLPKEKRHRRFGRSDRSGGRYMEAESRRKKRRFAVAGIAAVILVGIFLRKEPIVTGEYGGTRTGAVKVATVSRRKMGLEDKSSGRATKKSGSVILAEQGNLQKEKLKAVFAEKAKEPAGVEQIYQEYQKTTYDLAKAYEEEGRKEEALSLYETLVKSECTETLKEEVYSQKIRLELELDKKEQAKATFEEGKKAFPESEILKQYEERFKGEEAQKNEKSEEISGV